ncbi:type VII secretion system-associated protein [Actinosynnema sp. CS-041913]|uniref:type VII secretion system-associated protein n=1 Tax=Actinosynnema sp. CS-041913 TaxID=3239917 RepID=UPI003D8A36EA
MRPEARDAHWYLLMDPAWTATGEETEPPVESVMGLWPVDADAGLGRFRANPGYVPSDPEAPADPLDALFRLLTAGRPVAAQVRLLLRDSEYEVALGEDGDPLVVQSPDRVSCLLVATSPWYRSSSPEVASWQRVGIEELTDLLSAGADVLFNPGSPGSLRLVAAFVKSARHPSDKQLAAAWAGLPAAGEDQLRMLAWRIPAPDDGS